MIKKKQGYKTKCPGCELGLKDHMCDARLQMIKEFCDENIRRYDELLKWTRELKKQGWYVIERNGKLIKLSKEEFFGKQ